MTVGFSALTVPLPASMMGSHCGAQQSICHVIKGVWTGVGARLPASPPAHRRVATGELAPGRHSKIVFVSVMSASIKPRLAGRQPSNRGGVPRVMTRLSSHHNRLSGKRGSAMTGP
ncbi:hypothetical protein MOKP4_07310 [Mycobacterium avium subsp. hominissuis]